MMRVYLAIILLLQVPVEAQMLASNVSTPQGTLLTEGFGDSGSSLCGYGAPWNLGLYAYFGCNIAWGKMATAGSGTIAIGTPGGTCSTQWPAGPKALNIYTGTASGTYIETAGFTPTISNSC